MARGLLVAAIAAIVVALAAADARACTGAECYVAGRDAGRGAGHGVERPALPAGHRLHPGRQHDPRGRPVRLGRAALRPHAARGWASSAATPTRRQPGRIGVVGGLATDRAGHVYVLDSENDRVQVFEAATGRWLAAWGSTGQGAGTVPPGRQHRRGRDRRRRSRPRPTRRWPTSPTSTTTASRPSAWTATPRAIPATRCCRPARPPGDVVAAPTPTALWGVRGLLGRHVRRPVLQPAASTTPRASPSTPPPATCSSPTTTTTASSSSSPTAPTCARSAPTASATGQFRFPYDVGIDARAPRQLYVADNNNHRVQAFDFATLAFQRTWGQFGTEVGDFGYTRALAAVADDPAGGVAVADTANNRVQTLRPRRRPDRGLGHRRPRARLRHAPGGRRHRRGGHRPRGRHARPSRRAPGRRRRLSGADGLHLGQLRLRRRRTPGNGQFNTPGGIAVDRTAGRVWVADTANSRVQALGLDGTWQADRHGLQRAARDRGRARRRGLRRRHRQRPRPAARSRQRRVDDASPPGWPRRAGVAATSDAVYVADTGANRIQRIAAATTTTLPAPPGGLSAPTGLAAAAGAVYVADTGANRVLRFNEGAGTWDVIGTEGTGAGQFIAPHGLALDAGATHARRGRHGQRPPAAHHPERDAAARARAPDRRHRGHRHGHGVSAPRTAIWCPTDCRQGFSPGAVVRLDGPGRERLDLRRLVGRVRGQRGRATCPWAPIAA